MTRPHTPGYLPGARVTYHDPILDKPQRLIVSHTEPLGNQNVPYVVCEHAAGGGHVRVLATSLRHGWGD